MGALDPEKILVVLVIALVVLGPEKLPRVARQLGAAWRELTRFRDKVEAEVRGALPDVDLPRIPTRPSAAVASFISDLASPVKDLTTPVKESLRGQAAGNGTGREGPAAGEAPAETEGEPAVGPPPAPPAPPPPAFDRLERVAITIDDPSMN